MKSSPRASISTVWSLAFVLVVHSIRRFGSFLWWLFYFYFFLIYSSEKHYSGGNITVSLLSPEPNMRPGYNDFYNTPVLQKMVRATQVRIHLGGQYHTRAAGVDQRHRHYAIKEITISGRWVTSMKFKYLWHLLSLAANKERNARTALPPQKCLELPV